MSDYGAILGVLAVFLLVLGIKLVAYFSSRHARQSGDSRLPDVPGNPCMSGSADSGPFSRRDPEVQAMVAGYAAALKAGRLNPPGDMHDAAAWDRYWSEQVSLGLLMQAMTDALQSDTELPALLVRRGVRTVLCAGNGLSMEAEALALLGFNVTALDISHVPASAFAARLQNPLLQWRDIPGFALRDDGSVTFGPPVPIDPEICPPMHRSADCPNKGGGSLRFVTGDLVNRDVCPGPFDAIVDRRTVQAFRGGDHELALERLAARLADRALFVSHEHQGGWRPGEARVHHAESWLLSHGFVLYRRSDATACDTAPRLAYLTFMTG